MARWEDLIGPVSKLVLIIQRLYRLCLTSEAVRGCARVLIYKCVYGVGGRCTFGLDLPPFLLSSFPSSFCGAAALLLVHRVF